MLAQLKTVVLIKEAIKLAFFRLVEYREHQHVGSITGWKWPETKNFLLKLVSLFLFWEKDSIPCGKLPVYYFLHRTAQTGFNQNIKRCGRPRCTTEQEDKYIRVSSLRNRCLTSPQLAASLNSTHKTPGSMSTVKRRLPDAGLPHSTSQRFGHTYPFKGFSLFWLFSTLFWHQKYGIIHMESCSN